MTKQEIQAIRCLPAAYVRDGTQIATMTTPNVVVAVNPLLRPLMYTPGRGKRHKWRPIRFEPAASPLKP